MYRIIDFMVNRPDIVRDFFSSLQIRSAFQTYSERVQLWPPGIRLTVILYPFAAYFFAIAEIIEESKPPDNKTP